MTTAELQDLLIEKVLSGGNRTTAELVRNFLNESITSFINREEFAWNSTTSYLTGSPVHSGGLIWYAISPNTNELPGSGSSWTLLIVNTSAFSGVTWSGAVQAPTMNNVFNIVVSAPITKTSDYTFAIGDINKSFEFDKITAIVGTIPLNATVAFPIGTIIYLAQTNSGQLSIVATGGVTLVSADSYTKLRVQDSCAYIQKIGTNTWRLVGDLAA